MPAPPARVVSLACSNTEIVCALGLEERLVGVDDHSDFPREVVARLPRVGPDLTPDLERVAALEPDLVLATLTVPGHERIVEALERAGLPYLAPEPETLDDVLDDLRTIGRRLGVPERGEALARRLAAATAPIAAPPGVRPRIAVEWWPKPAILPGRRSWVHDLIERAGGRNPLGDEDVKSRPVPDGELADLAPDAIVISWCGVPFEKYRTEIVYDNAALASTPAVRRRRVHAVPEAWLGRPGPRLAQGFAALREIAAGARGSRLADGGDAAG